MKAFSYERASSPQGAASAAASHPNAKFIAGGTNLLDLMKLEVETPNHLIDVNRLKLDAVTAEMPNCRVNSSTVTRPCFSNRSEW